MHQSREHGNTYGRKRARDPLVLDYLLENKVMFRKATRNIDGGRQLDGNSNPDNKVRQLYIALNNALLHLCSTKDVDRGIYNKQTSIKYLIGFFLSMLTPDLQTAFKLLLSESMTFVDSAASSTGRVGQPKMIRRGEPEKELTVDEYQSCFFEALSMMFAAHHGAHDWDSARCRRIFQYICLAGGKKKKVVVDDDFLKSCGTKATWPPVQPSEKDLSDLAEFRKTGLPGLNAHKVSTAKKQRVPQPSDGSTSDDDDCDDDGFAAELERMLMDSARESQ